MCGSGRCAMPPNRTITVDEDALVEVIATEVAAVFERDGLPQSPFEGSWIASRVLARLNALDLVEPDARRAPSISESQDH